MENKETESLVEATNGPLNTLAEGIKKPTETPAEATQEPAEIPTGTSMIPSNKPAETSNKKTPKSLRAKNRMLKKALVVNPAKAPKKKANPQVRGMKTKKKTIESWNNEGEGTEERIARKDNLKRMRRRALNQKRASKNSIKANSMLGQLTNNHQTEKNKEKNSESEMNQQKLKKGEKVIYLCNFFVRKLTALFRPAELSISRPVRSPQLTITRDRGIQSHSHWKKWPRESDANGDSRSYRRHSCERDQNVGYHEGRREEAPRNLYLTEKEYRTYGLRGEGRDRTPPPPVAAPVVETYRRDYEREQLLRHPNLVLRDTILAYRETIHPEPLYLNDRKDYEREQLLRHPNLVLRDTIPAYRETIHPEPFYLNDREYQPYNLQARRELHAIPPVTTFASLFDPYSLSARRELPAIPPVTTSASLFDPYSLSARRELPAAPPVTTIASVLDPYAHDPYYAYFDRLYSGYAPETIPRYDQTYRLARPEALPATLRYHVGPSYSYL
ncbi:hypothetical protein UlMin_029356 [Ulmus minor]